MRVVLDRLVPAELASLMILDYYAGGDLYHLITESGALRPSLARKLFQQLISGIQFCHEHMIIHRDLKPENLLLSADHQTLVLSGTSLAPLSLAADCGQTLASRRLCRAHGASSRRGAVRCTILRPRWPRARTTLAWRVTCGAAGSSCTQWSRRACLLTATVRLVAPRSTCVLILVAAVDVLKKIARGDFAMPSYLPLELQDLLQRMMWPDPSERISTHEVLKHPWLSTLARTLCSSFTYSPSLIPIAIMVKAEPLSRHSRTPSVAGTITEELIDENPDIVDNLVLLGWDRDELRTVLLSPVCPLPFEVTLVRRSLAKDRDISKVFFNLLLTRRNQRKEEPKAVTSDEIVGSCTALK